MENYKTTEWFKAEQCAKTKLNGSTPKRWEVFKDVDNREIDINRLCNMYENYFTEYHRTSECSKQGQYTLSQFYQWGRGWISRFLENLRLIYKDDVPSGEDWLERMFKSHLSHCKDMVTKDDNTVRIFAEIQAEMNECFNMINELRQQNSFFAPKEARRKQN